MLYVSHIADTSEQRLVKLSQLFLLPLLHLLALPNVRACADPYTIFRVEPMRVFSQKMCSFIEECVSYKPGDAHQTTLTVWFLSGTPKNFRQIKKFLILYYSDLVQEVAAR